MSDLFPPTVEDLKVIGFNLARFSRALVLLLIPPMLLACFCSEVDILPGFLFGLSLNLLFCSIVEYICRTEKEMELKHALVIAALLWLFAPLIGSIPLWYGGQYPSFSDVLFESVSGFTGTGLTMTTRPELLPKSINFLRHLLQFAGDGVGIVVISLCIFGRTHISSFLLFRGEAREAGIRPSIVRTSRRIFGIAFTFVILGTIFFTVVGIKEGLSTSDALFDGVNHSMTAYATGGFSTHAQNILYYHSEAIELVALVLMIVGSLNFNLHYAIITGKRRELFRDIEMRFLIASLLVASVLVALTLHGTYATPSSLFRKGVFHMVSAHTTTGFQTIPAQYLKHFWPIPTVFILSLLMLIGGSANSTCGGIKGLRLGIILKCLALELKKIFYPSSAVPGESYYHLGRNPLTETAIRGAAVVIVCYLLLFGLGTLITVAHGYPLADSMFETASALGNAGLSCGITSPSMPLGLKISYIFLMWAGRLEIITVFVLFSFLLLPLKRIL